MLMIVQATWKCWRVDASIQSSGVSWWIWCMHKIVTQTSLEHDACAFACDAFFVIVSRRVCAGRFRLSRGGAPEKGPAPLRRGVCVSLLGRRSHPISAWRRAAAGAAGPHCFCRGQHWERGYHIMLKLVSGCGVPEPKSDTKAGPDTWN